MATEMDVSNEDDAVSEYQSSLQELTFNSKPHINMLTMLAEENQQHAVKIVPVIESHIQKVPPNQKLPVLYLIDSIVKNCASSSYPELFAKNIVKIFVHVFEKVDEKTRQALFKLRQTWLTVFAGSKLYGIDIKVHAIDPAWPVQDPVAVRTAQKITVPAVTASAAKPLNIHVNPKFIDKGSPSTVATSIGNSIELSEAKLPVLNADTMVVSQHPFEVSPKMRNFNSHHKVPADMPEFPAGGDHSLPRPPPHSFVPSVVTIPSRDPRLRRAAKRESLLGACPVPAPVQSDDVAKESRILPNERIRGNEPPVLIDNTLKAPELLSSNDHVMDRSGGGEYIPALSMKDRETRDENGHYERYSDNYRYKHADRPYPSHFNRRRNQPEVQLPPFREGVCSDSRVNDYGQGRSDDGGGVWRSKRSHNRRSDFGGTKSVKTDDRNGYRGGGGHVGAKGSLRSHGVFAVSKGLNKCMSESEMSRVDPNSRMRKSKNEAVHNDDEDRSSGRDVDFRILPIKKRRRSSDLCDVTELPQTDMRSRADSGSGYEDSKKRKEKLPESSFHARQDQDMRNIYPDKDDDVQIIPDASRSVDDLHAGRSVEAPGEFSTDSIARAPHGGDLHISVDAPILPDCSVTSIVEHRANIFQRADQQLADGVLSKQQYNEIMRDITCVMDNLQRPALISATTAMDASAVSSNRLQSDITATSCVRISPSPQDPVPATSVTLPTTMPVVPSVQSPSSGRLLPPPFVSVVPGVASQSIAADVTQEPAVLTVTPHASGTSAPSCTISSASAAIISSAGATEKNDGDGFEPIPANNRIFVDGRAYEVRYIDEVAVIERNGLPHRIYFVGAPRDVVVDGIAHSLPFGETRTVMIDGQLHSMRFGAPSRELYMGSYPFRGSFGGPPIFATINGVKHKIQLCGPPPEVKIDPEPAYELLRYIQTSHLPQRQPVHDYGASAYNEQSVPRRTAQATSTTVPVMPITVPAFLQPSQIQPPLSHSVPPVVDPSELISRLMKAGIIGSQRSASPAKAPTPPIPTVDRFQDDEVVERRKQPPAEIKAFSMKVLKVRYDAVVESLYRQKIQCSTCGMRFAESDNNKYSKHLDWHFKQNRREKVGTGSTSRPWYLAGEDWINYEESGSDLSTRARSSVFEAAQVQDENSRGAIVSTNSVITATEDDQCCLVCGEKFEQFWDEDEETWKLRNATLINSKAYHPLCYQDVTIVDEVVLPLVPSFAVPKSENDPSDVDSCFPRIKKEESQDDEDQKLKDGHFSRLISDSVSESLKKSGSSLDLLKSVLSVVSNARSSSVTTVTSNVCSSCSSQTCIESVQSTATTTCSQNTHVSVIGNNIFSLIPGLVGAGAGPSAAAGATSLPVDVKKVKQEPPDAGYECSAFSLSAPGVGDSSNAASHTQEHIASRSSTPLNDESPCSSPGTPVKDEIY